MIRIRVMRFVPIALLVLAGFACLLPARASAAVISRPANDLGLVSYWTLDGTDMDWATGQMTDRAGSYPMSAITLSTTTTPTIGKIGQAFALNQDGYLNSLVAYSPLNGTTGLTVCGWIYLNTLGTTNNNDDSAIFSVNSGATNSIILWYNVNNAGTDQMHGYTFNVGDTGDGPGRVNGNSQATANAWQFVCGVMSGSKRYVYLNGSLDGSTTGAATTVYPTNNNTASVASWSGGTSMLVNGKVDDVRVYNRALSATEIAALYGKGAAHVSASSATLQAGTTLANGLNGYWTLDGADTNWTTNRTTDRSDGSTDLMVSLSTSTAPVPGKLGQALQFNNSTSYINGGAWSSQATVYTVSVWFRIQPGGAGGTIFHRGNSSTCFYNPSIAATPTTVTVAETGCSNSGQIASGVAADGTAWTNVVEVRNGSSNTTYINGTVAATRTYTPDCSTCLSGTSQRVQIGANWHSVNGIVNAFGGQIDEVRSYNRALSAREVAQLYRLGAATVGASSATLTNGSSLKSSLTAHWTLDGADVRWATGQALDKSGNGNTGTLVSLSTTTSPAIGKIGQALNFKAAGGYVNTSVTPGSQGTAIAWIKPNVNFSGASASDMSILDTGNAGRNVFFRLNWAKGLLGTLNCNNGATRAQGEINFVISPSSGNYSVGCTSTKSWNANQWYMLAATWNGTTQKLYVNGVQEDSVSQTQSGGWGGAEIGASAGSTFPFNGTIDDVRIYSRVLSASEIKQLYNLEK